MNIESLSEYPEFQNLTIEQAKKFMPGRGHEQAHVYKTITRLVKRMGGKVLDVACGRGINAKTYSKDDYVGIDISPALIEVARVLNPGYDFRVADGRKLPFSDNTFDNVICKSYFEHLHSEEDAVQSLKEVIRVCKRQLLIAWHTIPGYNTTSIVRKQGTLEVPEDWDRKIYQNKYNIIAIMRAIPAKAKQEMEVSAVNEFQLWRILL